MCSRVTHQALATTIARAMPVFEFRSLLGSMLGFALIACGNAPLSRSTAPRAFTADDYSGIYQRWTRTADDFAFLELREVAHVTATYESHEFRSAYVSRYAADHSLPEESRQAMLNDSMSDAAERHRFLVTFGVPVFREGDFTSDRSDWRVILVDPNGNQTEPAELTRVARPSRDLLTYYPSISRQRHTYRLSFPITHEDGSPTISDAADHAILRFASAAGTVELRWDFAR